MSRLTRAQLRRQRRLEWATMLLISAVMVLIFLFGVEVGIWLTEL